MQFKRTRFPSRFWRLPVPKRRDSSRDPSARPPPPGLDPRIRSWILLDPEQEREDEKERRERAEQVERPPRDRLLDPERGGGQDGVDAPARPHHLTRTRAPGGGRGRDGA